MADTNALVDADENEAPILSESDQDSESDLEASEFGSEAEKITGKLIPDIRERPVADPRFNQPTPSPYKRAALVIFTILLFWVALSLRTSLLAHKRSPKVTYASRYSKDHKFRPAASPVITHTLKDGRIRIHGAGPTATPAPVSTATVKRTKGKRRAKGGAKRTKKASKRK